MSKKPEDSQSMKYLKQDDIGRVLAKAMSKLYQEKPNKPISYLAHWLLNYSASMKKIQTIKRQDQHKIKSVKIYQQSVDMKNQRIKIQNDAKKAIQVVHTSFEEKISNHQYHFQMILEELPEFLEKSKKLTGVYIGQLNHPPRKVTEDDVDENAHLNLDVPKLINYVGSSKSHSKLMLGKTLTLDKGVTSEVFNLAVDIQPVQGEQKKEKKKYIYIPDVVKNEKIHYFKIPKLGSYIAIPLIYKSYLYEKTFDSAFEQRKNYLKQKQQYKKEKQNQLLAINKQHEEALLRLKTHDQKNEHELASKVREQLLEIETRRVEKQKQNFEYQQPQYDGKKKQFVVCADTLGQDRQITEQDRQYLYNFIQKFKNDWQSTELRLLKQCVDNQIEYQNSLKKPSEAIVQDLHKQLQIHEQTQKQLLAKHEGNEKLVEYHTLIHKHDKLKLEINKSQNKKYLLQLAKYRILKFPQLIQNALYFLGKKKEEVDIPNTTHLNWKYVQKNLFNESFIKNLTSYDYKGAKIGEFKKYAKTNYLLEIFEKFSEEQVIQYNIGLGIVLKYLKNLLKLRLQDIEIRKLKIEQLKRERSEKLLQNQKILEQKQIALQQHKQSLNNQDIESFRQDEWLKQYEKQHPLIEIPPQIHDDVDNDI